jgi:hypothetical protein
LQQQQIDFCKKDKISSTVLCCAQKSRSRSTNNFIANLKAQITFGRERENTPRKATGGATKNYTYRDQNYRDQFTTNIV